MSFARGFFDGVAAVARPAAVLGLAFGAAGQALGVDIAPSEIDVLVTAVLTLVAIWKRRK